jgi:hypothetical protein
MARTSLPQRIVHTYTLQRLFSGLGFEDGTAIIGKAFGSTTVAPGHHQPAGTKSEMVFLRHGKDRALCHRYLKLDGNLGASGRHDPKMIEHNGIQYVCHARLCACVVCAAKPEDWQQFV